MSVKLIKFTTGEEVIVTVISQDDRTITFKDGLTMVYTQNGFQPVPFAMLVDEHAHITVNTDKIIYITDASKELTANYQKQMSPILQPNKGGIIV
jgi:secreted trypsin-like serine protease